MKRFVLAALAVLVIALPSPAQEKKAPTKPATSSASTAAELPIRRVVLYKNGIGYFEHRGRVSGGQELNIRFTTAQLNDVLKSLTVVDMDGGKVSGVRYNSIAPLSQRLSTLRLALDGNTDRASFLNALRGARIEARAGGETATGRLLSVEETTRTDKQGTEVKITQLSLVTDGGELRTFDLTAATSVRLLESDMPREVGRYMALLASARDKDVRQMTISTSGQGSREVAISYISEVPVWKSTYRIVLPKDPQSKPLLQGWAVVDNTVGEDWKDVQLSLVSGAPQSFVEQISQPYYVRRPTVDLPQTAMLTPQTHEGALEVEQPERYAKLQSPPPPPSSLQSGTSGGIIGGVLNSPESDRLARRKQDTSTTFKNWLDARQTVEVQSTAENLGDLFEYSIKQNVTVLQNQSALVPIVQAHIDAEKVTLWNDRERRPVRALWLSNSSGLTLDAGTFNIVEGGAFAGEGLLSEVRPEERRLISYASDTSVRVRVEGDSEQRPYTRVRAAKGILHLTRELRETRTYTISNSDSTARDVVIEHPFRSGWKFVGDSKPEESSNSFHRFRVKLEPKSSQKLKVAEFYPSEETYQLVTLDTNVIGMLVKNSGSQPQLEAALRKLLSKKDEMSAIERQRQSRRGEIERLGQEQARVRENMKSLKGSAEEKALLQRYVASLNQQEDRLGTLNSEVSKLEEEQNRLQSEYEQMAESITFDQTM